MKNFLTKVYVEYVFFSNQSLNILNVLIYSEDFKDLVPNLFFSLSQISITCEKREREDGTNLYL